MLTRSIVTGDLLTEAVLVALPALPVLPLLVLLLLLLLPHAATAAAHSSVAASAATRFTPNLMLLPRNPPSSFGRLLSNKRWVGYHGAARCAEGWLDVLGGRPDQDLVDVHVRRLRDRV